VSYYVPQAGDYYGRGDPGFLSSIFKVGKSLVKGFLGIPPKLAVPVAIGTGVAAQAVTGLVMPGGVPVGPTRLVGKTGQVAMMNGCCPSGFHPDKRSGTYCVRNRRMNVANPRALRRSMRRVQGFEKLAKRTITFTKRVRIKK